MDVSTDTSSRLRRKPVVFGCSFLLTAAGQSRIRTGFPFRRFPWKRHQQASRNIKGFLAPVNANIVYFQFLSRPSNEAHSTSPSSCRAAAFQCGLRLQRFSS